MNGASLLIVLEYEYAAADNISVREVVAGLPHALVIEDYPTYAKGPCSS